MESELDRFYMGVKNLGWAFWIATGISFGASAMEYSINNEKNKKIVDVVEGICSIVALGAVYKNRKKISDVFGPLPNWYLERSHNL